MVVTVRLTIQFIGLGNWLVGCEGMKFKNNAVLELMGH